MCIHNPVERQLRLDASKTTRVCRIKSVELKLRKLFWKMKKEINGVFTVCCKRKRYQNMWNGECTTSRHMLLFHLPSSISNENIRIFSFRLRNMKLFDRTSNEFVPFRSLALSPTPSLYLFCRVKITTSLYNTEFFRLLAQRKMENQFNDREQYTDTNLIDWKFSSQLLKKNRLYMNRGGKS